MSRTYNQWQRKVSLLVFTGDKTMDLSEFRIRFSVEGADVESPNSCSIRIYNLSPKTIKSIRGEYSDVVLQAGYEGGNYGVIFRGSIKQYRIGRENAVDAYLDILASDGDIGYNQGVVCSALKAGSTPRQAIEECTAAMAKAQPGMTTDLEQSLRIDKQYVPSIRGQVLFGMARARLRNIATHLDAAWSIQDGRVVLTDNSGYREGESVNVNVGTGLVGVPEQTDQGIRFTCLLNSRLRIGNLVKLNNSEITTLLHQNPNSAPIAYNQRTAFFNLAPLSPDGKYRALVIEHEGDTRGDQWHTHVVGLAFNESAGSSPVNSETGLHSYVERT